MVKMTMAMMVMDPQHLQLSGAKKSICSTFHDDYEREEIPSNIPIKLLEKTIPRAGISCVL